jgi:hypothetical protein
MKSKASIQNSETDKPSSEQLKAQLASHLEGQPENIRAFHRTMNVLEAISFGIMIIIFIIALVVSFMWKTIPAEAIPTAWFLLPVSAAISTLLLAVHTLVLKASPPSSLPVFRSGTPIRLPGKPNGFLTGKVAKTRGWGLLLVALGVGVFFAIFAWAAWTVNWVILTPMITILGVLVGVGIAVSILFNMAQKIFKTRKA